MAENTLEPLITECPGCKTRFRVNESQLTMASGRVRCGACLLVFTATDNLVIGLTPIAPSDDAEGELDELLDELARDTPKTPPVPARAAPQQHTRKQHETDVARPAPPKETQSQPRQPPRIGAGGQANPVPSSRPASAVAAPPVTSPELPVQGASAPEADVDDAADKPVEEIVMAAVAEPPADAAQAAEHKPRVRERRARAERRERAPSTPGGLPSFNLPAELDLEVPSPPRRRWWLLPVTLIAALLLVGQVLWFQFDVWSKDLRYRPIYEYVCPYVGCQLPVMRELTSIQSRNLVVRSHPQTPGALIVDALLVNQAPFPQPFPLVELRFSSMAGALVAGRRFEPAEYLAGELAGSTMMPPNTPIHISLEIEDPGTDAVNYVMVFR